MAIIPSIINWLNTKRLHEIDLFRRFPCEVQEEQILDMISKAQDTEFGKEYNFSEIKTIEQFQRNVPITNYEGLKPYVDKLREGEKDVLWPGEIRWFAKSSGTTSDKKIGRAHV